MIGLKKNAYRFDIYEKKYFLSKYHAIDDFENPLSLLQINNLKLIMGQVQKQIFLDLHSIKVSSNICYSSLKDKANGSASHAINSISPVFNPIIKNVQA